MTVANAFIVINAINHTIPVKVLTDGSFSLRENGNGKDLIALGLQNQAASSTKGGGLRHNHVMIETDEGRRVEIAIPGDGCP
ncbi:MAG: hypothetical protein KQI78_20070 [Deltaproteobacteria bacterium]|nr:hypothetical protein [Deltaproteobacteria bacterium]